MDWLSDRRKQDQNKPAIGKEETSSSKITLNNEGEEVKPMIKADEKANFIYQEQDKGVEEVYSPVYQMIPQQKNKDLTDYKEASKVKNDIKMVDATTQTMWKNKKKPCCIVC